MIHNHSDATLLRAFLDTTEHAITPLTRRGVAAGCKVSVPCPAPTILADLELCRSSVLRE